MNVVGRTDLEKKESSMAIDQRPSSSNFNPPPGFFERENSPTLEQILFNDEIMNPTTNIAISNANRSSTSTNIAVSNANRSSTTTNISNTNHFAGGGVSMEEALGCVFSSSEATLAKESIKNGSRSSFLEILTTTALVNEEGAASVEAPELRAASGGAPMFMAASGGAPEVEAASGGAPMIGAASGGAPEKGTSSMGELGFEAGVRTAMVASTRATETETVTARLQVGVASTRATESEAAAARLQVAEVALRRTRGTGLATLTDAEGAALTTSARPAETRTTALTPTSDLDSATTTRSTTTATSAKTTASASTMTATTTATSARTMTTTAMSARTMTATSARTMTAATTTAASPSGSKSMPGGMVNSVAASASTKIEENPILDDKNTITGGDQPLSPETKKGRRRLLLFKNPSLTQSLSPLKVSKKIENAASRIEEITASHFLMREFAGRKSFYLPRFGTKTLVRDSENFTDKIRETKNFTLSRWGEIASEIDESGNYKIFGLSAYKQVNFCSPCQTGKFCGRDHHLEAMVKDVAEKSNLKG